jgi:uncharacterized protein (TIGR03437 family)
MKSAVLILMLSAAAAFGQITAVNGASFQAGEPVAPGSFATIFGQNLCTATAAAEWTAPGQLPTTVGECSVSVGGVPAMLAYVSPAQINFIVPPTASLGRTELTISDKGRLTTGSVVVAKSGPGMFALNGMGIGEAAILHGTKWQKGPFSVTTDGQPTIVSIFVTGLDLTTAPEVSVGGVKVPVLYYGNAPGYLGLQQINVQLIPSLAGAGRVPVAITSAGKTSNVTFIHILPTNDMMKGMPGWGPDNEIKENQKRGRDASGMALDTVHRNVLVSDDDDDVVRVISLDTQKTVATISLPDDSEPHAVAVNSLGTLAVVALSEKGSVAFIDLTNNKVLSVLPTGSYPSHVVFNGDATLLVTNGGSGTLSVVDTAKRQIVQTVQVGSGASGIAVSGNIAVIANMQAGSVALVNLTTWAVELLPLPAGVRPHEVAIANGKALFTTPASNALYILDLAAKKFQQLETGFWNAMGPGAIAVSGNFAFVANQMSSSITVVDLSGATAKLGQTFGVDPGPCALVAYPDKGLLLVLSSGANVIDLVNMTTAAITGRIDAGETSRQDGKWPLPVVTAVSPTTVSVGGTASMVLTGSNLQGVKGLEFHLMAMNPGKGKNGEDTNIQVSNLKVNAAGTEVTATVQVLAAAVPGVRQIRLDTERGEVPVGSVQFTVTKP